MTSVQPVPAADHDAPLFTSRSERKRFLREHGLPADISTAAIPIVLAQRESGEDSDAVRLDGSQTADEAVHATDTEPQALDAASQPDSPAAPQASAWDALTARDDSESTPTASRTPFSFGPDVSSEAASDIQSAESSPHHDAPQHDDGAAGGARAAEDPHGQGFDDLDSPGGTPGHVVGTSVPSGSAPAFDLARRRVDANPTGPDFETSSTAVITPSALGDFDAPLRRRSPVVKPPTGANIRVVTGALPIVTPEDLAENPPTTPLSAIDESALNSASLGTGTFSSSSRPVLSGVGSSASAGDLWASAGSRDDEEEDSDELDEPPAKPMSARSVTHEDGTILVAERNSMVPYIVLGAAGFVALALVVIALLLLL